MTSTSAAVMTREHVFGRYRLRPGRNLLADGAPVTLGAKALNLLTVLVEAGGELVAKDRLMDEVWPGLVIEEHNIQVQISALRKALGKDASWIVTVSRRGYRFAGPLGKPRPAVTLPPALNRLHGRDRDLATVRSLLDRDRLVTIAGPGGIGKTRLCLELGRELASRYGDGAAFVDFSVLRDPSLVPSLVATTLGIELKGETQSSELLARRLKGRELLLLLDNCEHVVEAAAWLAELLLATAPSITLLATSREPLACFGEQVYRLPPLPVPAAGAESGTGALAFPAVALLVERLKAADPHFALGAADIETAGAICRGLDGLPLAIEMVGALAPSFGLETLAGELEKSLDLAYSVVRTVAPRHHSLEATLDWSHALLSPAERAMLRRLAVFPGPFPLEAAEVVLGGRTEGENCGDLLAGLVRKSLVSINPASGSLPFRLLDTIRTYAAEKLDEAGEQPALRAAHARYVAEMLERGTPDWDSSVAAGWSDRYGWLIADLRAALSWCFGAGGDTALGVRIVSRSLALWQWLNLASEGRRWTDLAATMLAPGTPDGVTARVWFAVGFLTQHRSFDRSIAAARRAAELFGRANESIERGAALSLLGQFLAMSGDPAAAESVLSEARTLLKGGASKFLLGSCAMGFGLLRSSMGALSEARREYELAAALFKSVGANRSVIAVSYNLAYELWDEGTIDKAIEAMRAVADLARRAGHRSGWGMALGSLVGLFTVRGDLDEALAATREAVPICRDEELLNGLFAHFALRVAKAGRPEEAAMLWGYADEVASNPGQRPSDERRSLDALKALLSARMEPEFVRKRREAGRYLTEEQAIALALA